MNVIDDLYPEESSAFLDDLGFTGIEPAEKRGTIGFIGAALGRGAARAVQSAGKGLQVGDIPGLDSVGGLLEGAGERMYYSDAIKPEDTANQSAWRRGLDQGMESIGPSLGPLVSGLAGTAVTGNPLVGAGVGLATLGEMFGGATYVDRRRDIALNNPYMSEDEAHSIALKDAGIEAGGELVFDVIAGATGGLFNKGAAKGAFTTIKQLLKTSPKKLAINYAKGYLPEVATETVQGKLQSDLDALAGTGEAMTYAESLKQVAIPTLITFGALHTAGASLSAVKKKAILSGLNSNEPRTRIKSANIIDELIDDQEVKQAWREYAAEAIRSGSKIETGEEILSNIDTEKIREEGAKKLNETDENGFQTVDQVIDGKEKVDLADSLEDYLVAPEEVSIETENVTGAMDGASRLYAEEQNAQRRKDRNEILFRNELERQAYDTYQPEPPATEEVGQEPYDDFKYQQARAELYRKAKNRKLTEEEKAFLDEYEKGNDAAYIMKGAPDIGPHVSEKEAKDFEERVKRYLKFKQESEASKKVDKEVDGAERIIDKVPDDVKKDAEKRAFDIVASDPVYRNMNEIKQRGGLNLDALKQEYDNVTVSQIQRRYPGVISKAGKMTADEAASELGYDSSDEMIERFKNARTKKELAGEIARDMIAEWQAYESDMREDKKQRANFPATMIATTKHTFYPVSEEEVRTLSGYLYNAAKEGKVDEDVARSIVEDWRFTKEAVRKLKSALAKGISERKTSDKKTSDRAREITRRLNVKAKEKLTQGQKETAAKEAGQKGSRERSGRQPDGDIRVKKSIAEVERETGVKLRYDGKHDGGGLVPDMHLFTALNGPAEGTTFTSPSISPESIKKSLEENEAKYKIAPRDKKPMGSTSGEVASASPEGGFTENNGQIQINQENPQAELMEGREDKKANLLADKKTATEEADDNAELISKSSGAISGRKQGEGGAQKETKSNQSKSDVKKAKKLRRVAERLEKQIEAKENPGVANLNMTARRARIARGMYDDARRLRLLQKRLYALADLAEKGAVPKVLEGINSKSDLEFLRFKNYFKPSWKGDSTLFEIVKGKRGIKEARDYLDMVRGPFDDKIVESLSTLLKVADKYAKNKWDIAQLKDDVKTYRRLKRLNIHSQEDLDAVHKALRGIAAHAEKKVDKVKELELNLVGQKIPGYFPTSKKVADRVVSFADIKPGMKVLEPSAGKGNLADAAVERGASKDDIEVAEINSTLSEILREKGYNVVAGDFNDVTGEYDRIIMNPPFEKRADAKHVMAAYKLLKPGGRLVAIVSEGPFFASDKISKSFRKFIEENNAETEKLERGDLADKSVTQRANVSGRIVTIDKPGVKFSKSKNTGGSTPSQIRAELTKRLGKHRLRNLTRKGLLKIVTPEQAEKILAAFGARGVSAGNRRIEAFYVDGTVHLIDGNIEKGQSYRVLMHELGSHLYLEGKFTGKKWDGIISTLHRHAKKDTPTGKAIRAAMAMVPKKTNPEHYDSEVLAYYIANQANSKHSLYRRVIAFIKDALVSLGFSAKIFSPEDLAVIAEKGLRGGTISDKVSNGVKFSIASDIKSMPAVDKVLTTAYPKWQELKDNAIYHIIDRIAPAKMVQNRYGKLDKELDYVAAEYARGKKAAAEADLMYRDEVKPILEELAKSNLEIADLDSYAWAKHTPERNARMKEVNAKRWLTMALKNLRTTKEQEYRDMMAGAERKDYQHILDKLFSEIPALEKQLEKEGEYLDEREWTEKEIEKGTPERLRKQHQNRLRKIANLKRLADDWEYKSERFAGQTDEDAKNVIKEYRKAGKLEDLERIRKMLAVVNSGTLDALEESGQITHEERQKMEGAYKYYVPLYREGYDDTGIRTGTATTGPIGRPIKTAAGSTRKVVDIFANSVNNRQKAIIRAHKAYTAKRLYNLVSSTESPDTWWIEDVPTQPTTDAEGNIVYAQSMEVPENGVFVKVDGELKVIKVNPDDKAMMRMVAEIKQNDMGQSAIVRAVGKFTRVLASLNTSLNPEFMLTNFTRDLGTAMVNLESEVESGGLQKKILKRIPSLISEIFNAETGKKDSKLYDDFKKHGGKIGWMDSFGTIQELTKKLKKDAADYRKGNLTRKRARALVRYVEAGNAAVENAVRLSTYEQLVKKGVDKDRAAAIASNLTVDFTRHGSYGPTISSIYMFANAGIQGSLRTVTALKSRKVQKIAGGIFGAAMLSQLLSLALGGHDDDGEWRYYNIDESLRDRNMVFMLPGGGMIRIPMPYGFNVFWSFGDEVMEAIFSGMTGRGYKPVSGAARMATAMMNAFNPLASATLLQAVSPTILDPVAMAAEGKTWYGGELYPYNYTSKPDSHVYWKNVSPISKSVAKWLNDVTGGNSIRKGFFDVSPETLDMLAETYGGGLGKLLKDIGSLPFKIANGDAELKDVPGIRKFTGKLSPWVIGRKYRDLSNAIDMAYDEHKAGFDYDKRYLNLYRLKKRADKRIRLLRRKKTIAVAAGHDPKVYDDEIRKLQITLLKAANN